MWHSADTRCPDYLPNRMEEEVRLPRLGPATDDSNRNHRHHTNDDALLATPHRQPEPTDTIAEPLTLVLPVASL